MHQPQIISIVIYGQRFPFSRCVFISWTCTCVLMGLLTTVCFVAAQLAVLYSITVDSVVGARVFVWHGGVELYLAVVIFVVPCRRQAGAIAHCQWGRVGGIKCRRLEPEK